MIVVIVIVIVIVAGIVGWWFWQRQQVWEKISADLSLGENVQILDMSVGNGKTFINLAKQLTVPGKIMGIVKNEKQAQQVKELIKEEVVADRAKVELTDNTNLPFTDHQFDYVLISNLQQVKPAITQGRVLQEAIRVLDFKGTLVITATTVQRYRQLLEYYRFNDIKVKQIGGQRVMVARRN
ncbi:methyltransferase domain-containing protein [Limosilactobacillus sp. pH52_RY]|uniref:class I SAM-dependent methyltransferase n=1 Tax=Limosilactobacillus balticus TaxID=2759747 RepID=UPI0015FB81D8|nr:methyltransferase domain-containing protein [Limosilactobacillus balticus]MBB1110162.1 methyltransferase domain-containing protein [Limosilactobacillus balticus]